MRLSSRKAMRNTLLFILAVVPLLGSGPPTSSNFVIPETSGRINAFTLDFLKQCANDKEAGRNAIVSPQSIFHGLAMSYVASGGQTRSELARVLHLPNDEQKLIADLAVLRRQFEAARNKHVDISLANAVWLDNTHAEFQKEYIRKVGKAFAAPLHSVRFNQPVAVSDEINRWVSDKTRGKIKRVVGPADFQSRSGLGVIDEPALVSVNAVYFKADWGSRFERGSTREGSFHVDAAKTEKAAMMHQFSVLPYSEDNDFKFLEIPYVDGTFSMYLLLPKKILNLRDLVSPLTIEKIVGLKRGAFDHTVDVLLPKFTVASHYSAKKILSEMGVKDAFDSSKADFDRMIVKKLEAFRVYITESYHDALVEVHEEGTTAAAATTTTHYSFGCSMAPGPPPLAEFHADHPFLFAIVHNQSYSILFAGWITSPEGLTH